MRGQVLALDDTNKDFGSTLGLAGLDHIRVHEAGDSADSRVARR
jgi:hypothetical protein